MSVPGVPKSRFYKVQEAKPADPFNAKKKYLEDYNPDKINLRSIAFRNEDGKSHPLPIVQRAQIALASDDCIKNKYLPATGLISFNDVTCKLLLGKTSTAILENKVINIHTLSSVASIRIAATFILKCLNYKTLYLSIPCNESVQMIFEYAGFKDIRYYRYWSKETLRLDFEGLRSDLEMAPENSVVFLYVCAHHPTAMDPSESEWKELSNIIIEQKLYPIFYSESLGLTSGNVDKDAYSIRLFVEKNIELICIQAFEDSFCLYSDRTSSLLVFSIDSTVLLSVSSNLASIVTGLYTSPASNGARIISYILNCPQFELIWKDNIKTMAQRIRKTKELFRAELEILDTPGDWSYITLQSGMFVYIPFSERQMNYLMNDRHIYLHKSGRMNITGINSDNVTYVAKSIYNCVTTL